MGKIVYSDQIDAVDPGDYLLSLTLKDKTGAVIVTSADAPVTVPVAPTTPTFEPPVVTGS